MKKLFLMLSVTAAGLLFAGCASVEVTKGPNLSKQQISTTGTTLAHINCQNSGIYLFTLPLLAGSTVTPGSIDVFKDTVNAESVVPMMAQRSKNIGATRLLDMASQYHEVGFIFYSRSFNVSANAVR